MNMSSGPIRPLLFLLAALSAFTAPARAEKLYVAVASNFTAPAKALAKAYHDSHGTRPVLSFGATGKLYAQIRNGAPFMIFMAADSARPIRLVEDGIAIRNSRFTYAKGRLVLWQRGNGTAGELRTILERADFSRLAIANPKTAPYGEAAIAFLDRAGLTDRIRGKLVYGENIAQTFQFVVTGNAQIGLIAASQVNSFKRGGTSWPVPEKSHPPILQQAVLLKKAAGNKQAIRFLGFLKSKPARDIISAHGYGLDNAPRGDG